MSADGDRILASLDRLRSAPDLTDGDAGMDLLKISTDGCAESLR